MKETKILTESSYSDRTTHKLELNFLSLSNYEIKKICFCIMFQFGPYEFMMNKRQRNNNHPLRNELFVGLQ